MFVCLAVSRVSHEVIRISVKLGVQFGHDEGKNRLNFGTGRPGGGAVITCFGL